MSLHLRAARVNAGLKQVEAAKGAGISKNTLISYEKYRRMPDIETAQKLAKLYGMTVDEIKWTAEA